MRWQRGDATPFSHQSRSPREAGHPAPARCSRVLLRSTRSMPRITYHDSSSCTIRRWTILVPHDVRLRRHGIRSIKGPQSKLLQRAEGATQPTRKRFRVPPSVVVCCRRSSWVRRLRSLLVCWRRYLLDGLRHWLRPRHLRQAPHRLLNLLRVHLQPEQLCLAEPGRRWGRWRPRLAASGCQRVEEAPRGARPGAGARGAARGARRRLHAVRLLAPPARPAQEGTLAT